jgi:ATP-binding protein involved in chromosome partitioning
MADQSAVEVAVGAVLDPDLHLSLDELDAVESVEVGPDETRVVVLGAVEATPLVNELADSVRSAASAVEGAGVVEVEVRPMTADQRSEVASRLGGGETARISPNTRVLAIASGKGGVGKSTVTTNLGVALADAGHSVGIIDADVWGFSIPKMLGIESGPAVWEELLVPPIAYGVRAISMDYFVGEDQAVVWRGPMLHKALEQFLGDVLWGGPEFLLIDMPPGTGDVAISISQFVPNAQSIVVTTPQAAARRVAKRAALMADKVEQEVIGVVENMSWFTGDDGKRYPIFGEGGGAALAAELGVDLLGEIPLVTAMRRGADEGLPVMASSPDSEVAGAFRSLAAEVAKRRPKVRTHPELVIR